ncbi:hypothetical protein DCAR_0102787 [Daucus carota subsp. sativus]|uniref:Zinc finger PHD-type domain-containing protein n=1 Tax=Daucus carota subsp. sativus TaxID=79200 RepID=A0AAF1AKP3_DAUCS|nr:hypothetical protein DCAR_0102787 [Daucus carota subsp. sativus]
MSSTLEHFSHPEHPLRLKEDVVIGENAKCHVCNKSVIGYPTYTCTSLDDIDCRNLYLHKTCAELPATINHHTHDEHPLTLLLRPVNYICSVCDLDVRFAYACDTCNFDLCIRCVELPTKVTHHKHESHLLAFLPCSDCCDVCYRNVRFAYVCDNCEFNVCVSCAFEQRVLRHDGHEKHILTLMPREALFKCDACGEEAKDSSYVCTTCDFWIHKSCAISPLIIPDPTHHHHPLELVYSIPDMHRYFIRRCNICKQTIQKYYWVYYCHKCTYFVHVKCAGLYLKTPYVETDDTGDEPDLIQFPLSGEESLFDLIVTQCGKLQGEFQGEGDDPHIIEAHWSHKSHPLEQLQFTLSLNDDDNDAADDDKKGLICDGCIQPITVSHPSYYACIPCGFFLHSFCATKLPKELSTGASPFHPEHSLVLRKSDSFCSLVACGACRYSTNGFFYLCETCDIKVDIRCAFLPNKIKHELHKHHSLVQRHFYKSECSLSRYEIIDCVAYSCQTCIGFQVHIFCAFYPDRMNQRYDNHQVTLRHPPFFYEGVFYCEICEKQVNNQWWLYHCGKCDHSFHFNCLRPYENVKVGGTIEYNISNRPHKLALVLKGSADKDSPHSLCCRCGTVYTFEYFLECDGCGFRVCVECAKDMDSVDHQHRTPVK